MDIHHYLYVFVTAFMTLFPVMNPIGNSIIVNGFLEDLDNIQRKTAIKKIIVNCLSIAICSLIAGHFILLLFGLAIPVVQLGGGILICKAGLEWLSGSPSKNTDNPQPELIHKEIEKKLFYPISFPLSVGPGTISVILTLMADVAEKEKLFNTLIGYTFIALALIVICIIFYIFLLQERGIMKKLGTSFNLIINKLVAFFTFCIGLQITITGISKIFHLTIL